MVLIPSKLKLYQTWLKNNFSTIETLYYNQIEDFTQNLDNVEGIEVRDFTLTEFSFIEEWEDGLIPSARVLQIMEMMDIERAARAKVTKRLQNYMFQYEQLTPTLKPIIAELDAKCVPAMVKYLEMMKRFFSKMVEIDDTQVKVSWIQQFFKKDKGDELVFEEMTLNQTIHHIGAFIDGSAGQRFHLGDQIIVFDEEIGFDDRAVHWIFAPRNYIELLRVLFNIKEDLGKDEIEYVKNLVKEIK